MFFMHLIALDRDTGRRNLAKENKIFFLSRFYQSSTFQMQSVCFRTVVFFLLLKKRELNLKLHHVLIKIAGYLMSG